MDEGIRRIPASSVGAGSGTIIDPSQAMRFFVELFDGQGIQASCVVCGDPTKTHPKLAGERECLCLGCAAEARELRLQNRKADSISNQGSAQYLKSKLDQCGLGNAKRMLEALAISPAQPDGKLEATGRYQKAAKAVLAYLDSQQGQGSLLLSGPSGCGKSTAACMAVWRTGGRFLPRSVWRAVPVRSQGGAKEVKWLARSPGVLVIDDCLAVQRNGDPADSDWEAEVIWAIMGDRHEAQRPTILTSQADDAEIRNAYGTRGEAILRRALQGASDLTGQQVSGGFHWCGGGR